MMSKFLVAGILLLIVSITGSYYYYFDYFHPDWRPITITHHATRIEGHAESSTTAKCLQTTPPPPEEGDAHELRWREIPLDSEGIEWFVYSAYLDRRLNPPLVRFIAMAKENGTSPPLFCQMWTRDGTFSATPVHRLELWVYAWDRPEPGQYYHPYLLSCPSPMGHPTAVAIATGDPCKPRSTSIPVLGGAPSEPPQDFVICLKPLRFNTDISTRFIEWLELMVLLGVHKVFVQVGSSVPQETWRILHHYSALGKITLGNYTAPPGDSTLLWQKRRHEMAFYNDCFYRHLDSHRYVVNLDLDEAILPVMFDTWQQLLSSATNRTPSASLSARCAYFFDALGVDPSVPSYMHMLRHVYRSSSLAPPGFAQKSFFSTELVEVVSNHFALRSVRPDTVRLMSGFNPKTEARLHHYRKECPALMERECSHNYFKFRQRDTLLWKYKEELENIVLKRMRELKLHSKYIESFRASNI